MLKKYVFLSVLITVLFNLNGVSQEYNTSSLISVKELVELEKSDENYNLIDLRKPEEFKNGHIFNAVNIWRTNIIDSIKEFGGYRVSKDEIENLFSLLNITNDSRIIIYDAKANVDAARLWWILKIYGFSNVSILNGGLTAWENEKFKLNNSQVKKKTLPFKFSETGNSTLIASLQDVKNAINDSNTILLDTRSEDEYFGKIQKKGAYKKGRIPSSILIDWSFSVDYNGDRKFKSVNEIIQILKSKGITKNKKIITYCQSGVRSAHTTFVLTELLGFNKVKNFDGSWIEWSYNDLPIETGKPIVNKTTKTDINPIKDNFNIVYYLFFGVLIVFIAFLFAMWRKKK